MKKLLLITLSLAVLCTFAHASLEGWQANKRLTDIIVEMDRICKQASTRLGSLKQEGVDIVSAQGADLDQADKTKLNTYSGLIQTARDALDATVAYKDANWVNL